ncbi:MAG: nuclear transport factor 2 family protein [Pseudomonadota bacterium]
MRTLSAIACTLILDLFSAAPKAIGQDGHRYITDTNSLLPVDELAIRQVVARTGHAVDTADYDLYLSFFADDPVMDSGFGPPVKGFKALRASLEASRPFITGKRHVAANVVINGSGDLARATYYLIVFERQEGIAFVGSAVIADDFERRDGAWKITRHVTRMDPATIAAMQAAMGSSQ